jgi:putative transposase
LLQFLQVRLETDDSEKELLLETMRQYNSAVNYVAEKAFNMKISNKYALQKLFYCEIRERFHLNAQLAIRAISKVVEVYKRDKSKQPRFRMNGAIQYDQRNLSWNGMDSISLNSQRKNQAQHYSRRISKSENA